MVTKRVLVSLLIGAVAGVLDVLPGIIQEVDLRITIAGFTFWIGIGFVVAHVSFPIRNWLKGLVIALILSIPGLVLISVVDASSVIPMLVMTVFLGPAVGHLTGRFAARYIKVPNKYQV